MSFNPADYRILIASSIGDRDGIGIEFYRGDEFLMEIFRDDGRRTREITVSSQSIPLAEMEGFIQIFKKEIPWEFSE